MSVPECDPSKNPGMKRDLATVVGALMVMVVVTCVAIATEANDGKSIFSFVGERLLRDFSTPTVIAATAVSIAIATIFVVRTQMLAQVTLACILGALVLIVALHVSEPGNKPLDYVMSTYAFTDHGYLLGLAVLLTSVAKFALGLLIHTLRRDLASGFGLGLLSCSAAGGFVAAVYQMDPVFPPDSMAGRLHFVGGLLMSLPFDVVAMALPLLLGRATFEKYLWPLVVLGVIGFLSGFAVVPLVDSGIAGLVQRLSVASRLIWLSVAAFAAHKKLRALLN